MLPDLVTPRLKLTPTGEEDLGLMRALNSDESVMRLLKGRPATAEETDAEWDRRLDERSDCDRGLGYWTGWHDGAFAGWWGLGVCSWDTATANLGYRLGPAHWGQGLATEGAATLLRHAFGGVGLASVWASTTRDNLASQRVLAKLSMRYLGVRYDQCQYLITHDEYADACPD